MLTQNTQRLDIKAFILISALSFFAGCAPLNLPPLEEPTENSRVIASADHLFINGNFEEALVKYEQLSIHNLSPKEKNHALYGLACARLMLAKSTEELIGALDDLHQWDIEKGSGRFTENRHLLVMALQHQATLIRERDEILTAQKSQKDKQIGNLSKQIADQNEQIAGQDKQISQLNSQLKKLQTQLLELEKIEENVQEKRTPQ